MKSWQAMSENKKQKLRLDYPCSWVYKVIGMDQVEMTNAVCEIIQDRPCRISLSRQSETARYISLNVEITVESDFHRTAVHEALKAHRAVKLVL